MITTIPQAKTSTGFVRANKYADGAIDRLTPLLESGRRKSGTVSSSSTEALGKEGETGLIGRRFRKHEVPNAILGASVLPATFV